jgi:hypothetical protein
MRVGKFFFRYGRNRKKTSARKSTLYCGYVFTVTRGLYKYLSGNGAFGSISGAHMPGAGSRVGILPPVWRRQFYKQEQTLSSDRLVCFIYERAGIVAQKSFFL